jgi:hypothetical protein
MRYINQWAYVTDENTLAFDIPRLLAVMNVEDTPHNRDVCLDEATKIVKELMATGQLADIPIDHNTLEYGTKRVYNPTRKAG